MSDQSREHANDQPAEPENHGGSLSIEDDPDGTQDPADLAGTASSDDETVGYQPTSSEADKL
jgi:hypothetical protein